MLSAALFLTMARVAPAAPFAFATDGNTDLYSVNLTTGAATLIGSTGVFFESIALSLGGDLYGASSGGLFYSINTGTGTASLIGNTGLGNIEGLDYNGSTLLATDFANTPHVYSIDPATGLPTLVTTFGSSTGVVRSMAVQDPNTILVRTDGPVLNSLQSVNLTTGAVSLIGTMPVSILAGMDYLGGVLYGLDSNGSVYIINDNTAAVTLVADTGDQFWLSMATYDSEPVPEPASLTLLAGGLGLLLARRRRA